MIIRKSLPYTVIFVSVFTVSPFLSSLALAQGNSGKANGQPFEELQSQIDDLKAIVDSLSSGTPVALTVDCGAGESVGSALATVPGSVPVQITIEGQCAESLFIVRDDVTLQGNTAADGFVGSGPGFIFGASRNFLSNMTIDVSSTGYGVGCFQGSVVNLNDVTIQGTGGGTGIFAVDGGQCKALNTLIDGLSTGVFSMQDSLIDLEFGTSVVNSTLIGVRASQAGNIRLQGTSVTDNTAGIQSSGGGHISIINGTVSNNAGTGISVDWGATFRIDGATSVENNQGDGISVNANSTLIHFSTGSVTGNSGWGIQCTADSNIVGSPNVFGNALGDIDCP